MVGIKLAFLHKDFTLKTFSSGRLSVSTMELMTKPRNGVKHDFSLLTVKLRFSDRVTALAV